MFENLDYMGAYAPNVAGDNATYGYYVNGHGLTCTVCHDAGSEHIDHNQRTYGVDETTCDPGPCEVVTSYERGYRLSDVLGQRPMVIPKESVENPTALDPAEFALCFKCHDSEPLLALHPGDPAGTNFHRDGDPYDRNFHSYHLGMQALVWDSDWDAVIDGTALVSVDSMPSCTACHNVHGSPSATMTRHGELISPVGTTDKVPSLDFCYARTVGGRDCDVISAYPDSVGASMYFLGYPERGNFVCVDCHGGYAYYYRNPVDIPTPVAPVVSNAGAVPLSVANDGSSAVLFTAFVVDPTEDLSSVEIDLSALGGSANQAMYDDGTHGDAVAGNEVYSYLLSGTTAATGNYTLTITATDALAHIGTGRVGVVVHDDYGAIIVDNLEADFVCNWASSPNNPGPGEFWGFDVQFRTTVGIGCQATWVPDVPTAGDYNVYARWTSYLNRPSSAPYTINYSGGSHVEWVNQQADGGAWYPLGTYNFAAGRSETSGSVVLSDNATGGTVIIADAIKLEPVP